MKTKGIKVPYEKKKRLLDAYQNKKYDISERLSLSYSKEYPKDSFGWKILGLVFFDTNRATDALEVTKKSLFLEPQDSEAHNNLGIILQELNRLEEAEASYRQALALRPDLAEAHFNLGITLQELGRLKEAETCYKKAIALKPDHAYTHYYLGITLQELGRLKEAEDCYKQTIVLKSDYAEAYFNLGIIFQEMNRLKEAEDSYKKAISSNPDYAIAYNNLGFTLKDLGRLEEAKTCYKKAITLKPDHALAYSNLCRVLYYLGDKDLALESIEKAYIIDPESKIYELILNVIKSRNSKLGSESEVGDTYEIVSSKGLKSNPFISHRMVEKRLITKLYEINPNIKKKTKDDARFGTRSSGFNLFEDPSTIIQTLAADLTKIMMNAVNSEIYIYDSFCNILSAGGGTTPHNHINDSDKDIGFDLGKQKYSLQYYISVGDQNCSEPGVLKLYEPDEGIMPYEGMITIIPASRLHSAVYSGKIDRIMIGVNFYSIWIKSDKFLLNGSN